MKSSANGRQVMNRTGRVSVIAVLLLCAGSLRCQDLLVQCKRIVVAADTVLDDGMLLVRQGKIAYVGNEIPADARGRAAVVDYGKAVIVPGFVLAQSTRAKAPAGAKAYIIAPKNGDTVSSPVTVQFGLKGMGVAPANVNQPETGHHHLMVDLAQMPDMNIPLPMTDNIKHFGKGQTETDLTLPPGRHTLQLIVGDYLHIPFDPPIVSEKITITVK